jgi:transcription termination factor Rho
VDVSRSSTRQEELLLDAEILPIVWAMRMMMATVGTVEGTEMLLSRLARSEDNATFLESLSKDVA